MTRRSLPQSGRAALLATLSEQEWQTQVTTWAARAGYRTYHTHDSRRSAAGFVDLVLVKPGRPVIFAELKTVVGRLSAQQRVWIDELQQADGAVCCVWRPTDEAAVKEALGLEE